MNDMYQIENGKVKLKVYCGSKFPGASPKNTPIHKHGNAEIHVALFDEFYCTIQGIRYDLKAGDAIFVPAGAFHHFKLDDRQTRYVFQIDINVEEVIQKHFSPSFIQSFFEAWKNGESIINHIVFMCNEFFDFISCDNSLNNHYKHIIGEFFAQNYHRNARVSDLAEKLHLSEMQTQRLVKKYTGKTFIENLRIYRITIADYLSQTTDMTMEEISKYVGYASYNGFWKAHQKMMDYSPGTSEKQ